MHFKWGGKKDKGGESGIITANGGWGITESGWGITES